MIASTVFGARFANNSKVNWPVKDCPWAFVPLTFSTSVGLPVKTVAVTLELLLVAVYEIVCPVSVPTSGTYRSLPDGTLYAELGSGPLMGLTVTLNRRRYSSGSTRRARAENASAASAGIRRRLFCERCSLRRRRMPMVCPYVANLQKLSAMAAAGMAHPFSDRTVPNASRKLTRDPGPIGESPL